MFQEISKKLKHCLRCVLVLIMTVKAKTMEHFQNKPSEEVAASEFDEDIQYTPDLSDIKVSPGNTSTQTKTNGYFQNNTCSRENNYGN